MEISKSALTEVESALKQYRDVVLKSELSPASQAIYIDHATNFVRWVKGEYIPGARVDPFPLRRKRNLPVHAFNPDAATK